MKKLILLLLSALSLIGFSQIESPDSLSIGGDTYFDSIFVRNDTLIFRIATSGKEYPIGTKVIYEEEELPPGFGDNAHFVSNSLGNDVTGDGSQEHPWKTPAYAETQATNPGDTIFLRKGDVWAQGTCLNIHHSGTAAYHIVWNGNTWGTGQKAIIRSNGRADRSTVRFADVSHVTFEGITVDVDNTWQKNGITIGGWVEIFGYYDQNNEHDIIIQNCNIWDAGSNAGDDYSISLLCQTVWNEMRDIKVQYDSVIGSSNHGICFYNMSRSTGALGSACECPTNNSYIGYNYVADCGKAALVTASHIALTVGSDTAIVEYNTIRGGSYHSPGICFSGSTLSQTRGDIIRYNDVRVNGTQAVLMQNGGLQTIDFYYNLFYSLNPDNSVIRLEIAYGGAHEYSGDLNFWNNIMIAESNSAANCNVFGNDISTSITEARNNIFVHTGTDAGGNILLGENTPGATAHSNNLYYRTLTGSGVYMAQSSGSIYTRSTITSWEATAREGNPLFITNYTNLHIQAGSPAINNGVNIPSIPRAPR